MKKWITSLNGAVALSIITLISHLWRGFLDAMFVFPNDIGDETSMHLAAIIYTLLFTGWAWVIISAARGSRRGLVAAFTINAIIFLVIPVSTLLFYCPIDCLANAGWPFILANTLNLVLGFLTAVSLALQLRQRENSTNPQTAATESSS